MYTFSFHLTEHAIHLSLPAPSKLRTAKLIANFDYRRWLDEVKTNAFKARSYGFTAWHKRTFFLLQE